jgi:hypothetical protein
MSRGDELVGLLRSPDLAADDADPMANELLKEFLGGYPLTHVTALLDSGVPRAVKAGAWICSELGQRAAPLMDEIGELLHHEMKYVRFFAIDAVLAAATPQDGPVVARAIELISDADGAVRWKALLLLARAPEEQLNAAVPHLKNEAQKGLTAWLVAGAAPNDIRSRLQGRQPLVRLFAAAAAARTASQDPSSLVAAAATEDDEVASFAREQLDLLALLRNRGREA